MFFEPRADIFRRLPKPASISTALFKGVFAALLLFDGASAATMALQLGPRGAEWDAKARLRYEKFEGEGGWEAGWPTR